MAGQAMPAPPLRTRPLPSSAAPAASPPRLLNDRSRVARRLPSALIAAAWALSVAVVAAWAWLDGLEAASVRSVAALKASGTVTEAAPSAQRHTTAVTDQEATLARLLSAASLPFASAAGDAAAPEAVAAAARGALVLLRYDVLEATAAQRGPALQLLGPLYAEALYFVVRTDSPWRALHQIGAAARINVGPADSARAATAAASGSALFGARWRERPIDPGPARSALPRLVAGDVDVALLVGDELAPAWRDLPQAQRQALRLRPLDERDPSAASAQRRFLPARLPADPKRPDEARLPKLAVMNFLATGSGTNAATAARTAQVLCAALPALRHDAAVWRQMRPAQTLPAPWPYAPSAVEVFEHCESPQPAPTGASSQVPQIPPPVEEWKPS